MRFMFIGAILLVLGLIYIMYNRENSTKKVIVSFLILWGIITLAILGNIMRSITPLFLTHLLAIILAYGGLLYYVLRGKFLWLLLFAPIGIMILYLLLVWVGNEHLPFL